MKVTDPQGQTWRVTRRWVPWRRRGGDPDVPDTGGDGAGSDGGGSSGLDADDLGIVLLVLLAVIILPFLLFAVFALLELLLLVLLLPFAVAGRVFFGRHWHVELRRGFTPWWEVEAGDWRASALKIHEVADDVRRGEIPARTIGVCAPDEAKD